MSTAASSTASDDSTDTSCWLAVTEFLDHDQPGVRRFAETTVAGTDDPRERAVKLFYAVRDGYWYDPYSSSKEREAFRASSVVDDERSWCAPKSILLTAAARAVEIPARLGFADVRNHLQSASLQEKMGTDLFVFHGYSEFLLHGSWVKASAAFNLELCQRFGTRPLDFNGRHDATRCRKPSPRSTPTSTSAAPPMPAMPATRCSTATPGRPRRHEPAQCRWGTGVSSVPSSVSSHSSMASTA